MILDGDNATYVFDDDEDQDPRARVIMDAEENKLSITEVQLSSHEDLHMNRTLDIIVEIPQVSSFRNLLIYSKTRKKQNTLLIMYTR